MITDQNNQQVLMFGNNNPPIRIGVPVSRLFRSNSAQGRN